MEVEIKNPEAKTKMDQAGDEKKKTTKEHVIGLGQEEFKRRGNYDPNKEIMMKLKDDDKKFREISDMTEKEERKENLRQKTEIDKEEDQKQSFRQNPEETKRQGNSNGKNLRMTTKPHVWDCGTTLYDSFELNSFKRQLDSAISASSARSISMPHLPHRRLPPPHTAATATATATDPPPHPLPPPQSSSSSGKKNSSKISRSLQKLLKSVFKSSKHHQQQHRSSSTSSSLSDPCSPTLKAFHDGDVDRYYVVYDKSGSLTTIPESAETDLVGPPEISSLVRKTASERFTVARAVGVSCA